ncbi:hypothetical protein B0T17DRAFT_508546 [Bombardia bombarda]|uniref:Uncharacterized protein n=1 Tax=Bombardia bombarda TaxID=252184 RepID=A0AA40C1M2_9PEZI|nr:hypothetical protein B0T17DRAFT_508546 [Bombardia bombarda]
MVGVPGKFKGCNTCRPEWAVFQSPPRVVKSSKKGKASSSKSQDRAELTPDEPQGRLELVPIEPLQSAWSDLISLSNLDKRFQVQIAALFTSLPSIIREAGDDDDDDGGGKLSSLSLPSYENPDVQPFLNQDEFWLRSQCLIYLSPPDENQNEIMQITTDSICLFLFEHNHSLSLSHQPPWKDPAVQNDIRRPGPLAFRTFPDHHFFVRVWRPAHISTALLNRTPTFLAAQEWLTTPWEIHPKCYLDYLMDKISLLPAVFHRADRMLAQAPTLARRLMAQDLLNNCLNIERDLDEWYALASPAGGVYQQQQHQQHSNLSNAGSIPFSTTYAFRDSVSSLMFIYYWMSLVLFYPCIDQIYWAIYEPVVDDPAAAAAAIISSQQQPMPIWQQQHHPQQHHLQHSQPHPNNSSNLHISWLKYGPKEVRELAANICRSLDYALNMTVQPDLLTTPLFVVRRFYEQQAVMGAGDGRLELMWCDGFRARLVVKGRDIQEVVQDKRWQDLASY